MSSNDIEFGEDNFDLGSKKRTSGKFDLENFLFVNRIPLTLAFLGVILIGVGLIVFRSTQNLNPGNIEVLEADSAVNQEGEVVVELSGAVEKTGVYRLKPGSRVEDLFIASGGLSSDADRNWVDRMVNRAAKLVDGQKIYIPYQNEVLSAENDGGVKMYQAGAEDGLQGLVNINTSSQSQLENLPGIGPVYAQSIIEHRPYSNIEELLDKGVLKKSVYEKIKDRVTSY